jgi:hypothetical protein
MSVLLHVHAVSPGGLESWHSVHGGAGRDAAFASAARSGSAATEFPAPDLSWLPRGALSLRCPALACGWDSSVTRFPAEGGIGRIRVIATHLEDRDVFIAFWHGGHHVGIDGTLDARTLREGREQISARRRRPTAAGRALTTGRRS